MRPLIGITMNIEHQKYRDLNILDLDYGRAVIEAGGIPVPIMTITDYMTNITRRLDGFVFSGGDDIHPRFYGERPLDAAKMQLSSDSRTRFEIKLFLSALHAKKPILAICHGMQLMNIALGGSLYQDITLQFPRSIKHKPSQNGEKLFHPVAIMENTRLYSIMGTDRIRVRSSHHQSVKNPGKGLRLSALSSDGVIEALEGRDRGFLVGVQWHPEKSLNDLFTKRLFKALVDASKK